jgi:hypothetical protein
VSSILLPDLRNQLQHGLNTSFTAIHSHAQLLARAVKRSPSLAEEELARMLKGLTTIETEVRAMVSPGLMR